MKHTSLNEEDMQKKSVNNFPLHLSALKKVFEKAINVLKKIA
jgi:hypothetical protein